MKRFLTVILSLCLIAALTGCSKKADNNTTETSSAAAETTATAETAVPSEKEPETEAETEPLTEAETEAETEAPASEPVNCPAHIDLLLTRVCETGQAPDNRFLYKTEYPAVHLSESAQGLDALSLELFEDEKYCRDLCEEEKGFMISSLTEDLLSDPYFQYLYNEIEGTVIRADENVVSIRHDFSGYYGGVHGDYTVTAYNYDAKTGKPLSPADIVTDTNALYELLCEKLNAIPDTSFFDAPENLLKEYDFSAAHRDFNTGAYSFNFAVGNTAAIFWFNPYEINSYADGLHEIVIPYADYPELFVKEYTTCAENFFEPVSWYTQYSVGGSTFTISPQYNEYGFINGMDVNGEVFDVFTYNPCTYLARSNGNYYLYIFEDADDDEVFLDVIDLNGEKPVRAGRFPADMYREHDLLGAIEAPENINASAARITVYPLTDPEDFLLKTPEGVKEYKMGENGLPVEK